jgi:NAD(P)H dehydrogenase (quinone)
MSAAALPDPLAPFGLAWRSPLHGIQLEGVARLLASEAVLLADEMGLGKTIQAIAALRLLASRGDVRSALRRLDLPTLLRHGGLSAGGNAAGGADGRARRCRHGYPVPDRQHLHQRRPVGCRWRRPIGSTTMNVFIVLAHPERRSFNGALFDTAVETFGAAGHLVRTSDLYRMGFEPRSGAGNFTGRRNPDYLKLQLEEMHATETGGFAADVEQEIRKIEVADLMILQFPLWWFGLPAILKGWVDRTFAMGRTYGNGRFYETGRFRGKRALLSLTTGGPAGAYQPDGFNGDILSILRPVHRGILEFVGFEVLAPAIHYGPAHVDDDRRRHWLAEYARRLRSIEGETAITVGRY